MRLVVLISSCSMALLGQHGVNTMPSGSMHVEGNRLVDTTGRAIILRGAEIPGLQFAATSPAARVLKQKTLSATTFSTMRQRWNMNALRLPVAGRIAAADPTYLARVDNVVHKANVAGLVVILAECGAAEAGGFSDIRLPSPEMAGIWRMWAAHFKRNPLMVFDLYNEPQAGRIPGHRAGVHSPADWQFWLHGGTTSDGRSTAGMQSLVDAIRSVGATQVIAVMGFSDKPEFEEFDERAYVRDPNILYEVHPFYSKDLNHADRDAHFGFLARRFPVLAGEWGFIPGEDSENCRAVPEDPAEAEALVESTLQYFEANQISWTIASFLPGNLFVDFSDYFRTDLFRYGEPRAGYSEGWTCGVAAPAGMGIGQTVNYYLDGIRDGDLVPVAGGSGNVMAIAPGAVVHVYGSHLSYVTLSSSSDPPPLMLGGISVEITDSSGAVRSAPLLYVSPDVMNLVLPTETAPGIATFAIRGGIGDGLKGHAHVQTMSPGLVTSFVNSRGPVLGTAEELLYDGTRRTYPIWQCKQSVCKTVPIAMPKGAVVSVSVVASGIRNRSSFTHVDVTIGGIPVPVLYAGVQNDALGIDEVKLRLIPHVRGLGETDLLVIIDGEASNAVRINIK